MWKLHSMNEDRKSQERKSEQNKNKRKIRNKKKKNYGIKTISDTEINML